MQIFLGKPKISKNPSTVKKGGQGEFWEGAIQLQAICLSYFDFRPL